MAQQQGIEESRVSYNDIMVIGKTGQGPGVVTELCKYTIYSMQMAKRRLLL